MQIVVIGPPGCGKGTQSERISRQIGIPHLSTGEMLRSAIREGTPVGKKIAERIDHGNLAADELILELVGERIGQADCESGCVFDGFPRTVPQIAMLDRLLEEHERELTKAIEIRVEDDELVRRITERSQTECRQDDTPETLRHRLEVFHLETLPVVTEYRDRGIVRSVDGLGAPETVYERIERLLTS